MGIQSLNFVDLPFLLLSFFIMHNSKSIHCMQISYIPNAFVLLEIFLSWFGGGIRDMTGKLQCTSVKFSLSMYIRHSHYDNSLACIYVYLDHGMYSQATCGCLLCDSLLKGKYVCTTGCIKFTGNELCLPLVVQ